MGPIEVRCAVGERYVDVGGSYASSIGAGRTYVVLDRLFGVCWKGGGFETVDRCRFLEGVASSGGRREREVCNLSYNLYLLARAHFRTHQRLGKPSLKPVSGCCLMSSRPGLRPSCAAENARSHSFNSFRRFNNWSS